MQASSGPPFLSDFFGLFSKIMKKMKSESLAGVWEISDVRQRHIEIWWSVEMKVDCFRGCTGPKSQSVTKPDQNETHHKRRFNSFMNANFQLVYLSDASRPGLPGESSFSTSTALKLARVIGKSVCISPNKRWCLLRARSEPQRTRITPPSARR